MNSPQDALLEPDLIGLSAFVEEDSRLGAIRSAGEGVEAYLVGGSVRDLLLGLSPTDLDVAIEGDPSAIVRRLDPDATEHPRFLTASLELDGDRVDLAATRTETYVRPGALPDVEPASLEEDLARRDFTINAIAVPLSRPGEMIDPFDGIGAIRDRRLSILRPDSFREDPLRALRGARYAARFGFAPDDAMDEALRGVELGSVSDDRLAAELGRLAAEDRPQIALGIAQGWGLVDISGELVELVGRAAELLDQEPWSGFVPLQEVVLAALERGDEALLVPDQPPRTKIDQFDLLDRLDPGVMMLARAAGREWLDWWPRTGAGAALEIDGQDLIEAGIEPGPGVGVGLRAALAEYLETGVRDRERQLATALAAAGAD